MFLAISKLPARAATAAALARPISLKKLQIELKTDFIYIPLVSKTLVRVVAAYTLNQRRFVPRLDIVHPTSPLRAGGT
jgi:hypothetical protein